MGRYYANVRHRIERTMNMRVCLEYIGMAMMIVEPGGLTWGTPCFDKLTWGNYPQMTVFRLMNDWTLA